MRKDKFKLHTAINDVTPAKVLHKLPDYLDEKSVIGASQGTKKITCLDLGNLSNLKRFMVKYNDHKNKAINNSHTPRAWAGTDTWEEYLELLENGDEVVMKKIKISTDKQVAELGKKYEDVIKRYRFDVTGEFFDVGLVLSGVPECWLIPEETPEEILQIDILINGAFSNGFNQKKIVKSSVRLIAMAKILEDNGVQVGMKLVNNNASYDGDYNETLITTITLKGYDEPISYRKMSALLTPAHHRRGLFKIMEVASDYVNSGYGSPVPIKGLISLDDERAIDKLEHKLFKAK